MKKSEMIERVAGRMGLGNSAAEGAIDAVLESISDALAGKEGELIAGFRTLATRSRSARTRGNRRAGESVTAPGLESGVVQGGRRTQRLSDVSTVLVDAPCYWSILR